MAMDKLFKGILQVTETSFKAMSDNDKLGHIIFVRKDTSKNDGDAEVWFGKKRYGTVEATRLAEIESSIETLGGRVDAIDTTLGDFTAQLTGNLKTVAAVVASHESRLDTAESKITTIEKSLSEEGEIGKEINEIRELPTNELVEKVKDLKQEYFTIRFQQATGQNQDANRKRVIRKDIARILTVIRERELEVGGTK